MSFAPARETFRGGCRMGLSPLSELLDHTNGLLDGGVMMFANTMVEIMITRHPKSLRRARTIRSTMLTGKVAHRIMDGRAGTPRG